MAWTKLMPADESTLRRRGWNSVTAFLEWTGVLVNRHRHRQVEAVSLDTDGDHDPDHEFEGSGSDNSLSYYLKKQSAVSWRERLRNAWHGFGWNSTVVREALLLQKLKMAGIACAEVVAFGEASRQAFVLLRDQTGMVELRAFLQTVTNFEDRHELAVALGKTLARIHAAGYDHPDLYAKHILATRDGKSFRFCVLDWQRSRRRAMSWRWRCRDLAALDATLHDTLASDRLRLTCLAAYRAELPDAPDLADLAGWIRRHANRFRKKRNILEIGQLPVPDSEQRFVPLCNSRLWVVQAFYEKLGARVPMWLRGLCEPECWLASSLESALATEVGEPLTVHSWPTTSFGLCPLDLPLAHTLFRLHRFGVASPRLLAVGRSSTRIFALTTPITATCLNLLETDLRGARTERLYYPAGCSSQRDERPDKPMQLQTQAVS